MTGSLGAAASTYNDVPLLPIAEARTSYYVNLAVADVTGVLAAIAAAFARHGVSIAGVRQDGVGDEARLIVWTHAARQGDLDATLSDLRDLDPVREVVGAMRVLGDSEVGGGE